MSSLFEKQREAGKFWEVPIWTRPSIKADHFHLKEWKFKDW
jgi:hypothetical protein